MKRSEHSLVVNAAIKEARNKLRKARLAVEMNKITNPKAKR